MFTYVRLSWQWQFPSAPHSRAHLRTKPLCLAEPFGRVHWHDMANFQTQITHSPPSHNEFAACLLCDISGALFCLRATQCNYNRKMGGGVGARLDKVLHTRTRRSKTVVPFITFTDKTWAPKQIHWGHTKIDNPSAECRVSRAHKAPPATLWSA